MNNIFFLFISDHFSLFVELAMPWPLGNMATFGQPATTASGQRYQPQSLVNSKPQSMQPQNHQPQQFLYNNSGNYRFLTL